MVINHNSVVVFLLPFTALIIITYLLWTISVWNKTWLIDWLIDWLIKLDYQTCYIRQNLHCVRNEGLWGYFFNIAPNFELKPSSHIPWLHQREIACYKSGLYKHSIEVKLLSDAENILQCIIWYPCVKKLMINLFDKNLTITKAILTV